MKIEPKTNCPLDNFNPCRQMDCAWFIQVRGTNPNSGKEVDEWACSMAWMPILLIENSQQQRGTGAAVESFRNEMVKVSETNTAILIESANLKRLS
jgi:hypothetical protein